MASLVMLVWSAYVLPIHIDEALTHRHFADAGWKVAVSTYPFPNNHFLFSFLAAFAIKLPLDPVFLMRLIAVLSALANGWLIYRITHIYTTTFVSVFFPILWLFSLGGFYYATHARGYGLQLTMLLAGIHCVLGWKAQLERGLPMTFQTPGLLFIIVSALGFFTVPTFLIPFSSLMVWLFSLIVTNKQLRFENMKLYLGLGIGTMALTFLLYLPLFYFTGIDAILNNQWVMERKLENLSQHQIQSTFFDVGAYIGIVLIALSLIVFAYTIRAKSNGPLLFLTPFLLVPLIFVVTMDSLPFARTFAYLPAIFVIFIVSALSNSQLLQSKKVVVLLVGVVAISGALAFNRLQTSMSTDTKNALHIQQQLSSQFDQQIIYVKGWDETAHLIDYYSWRTGLGPSVKFIYDEYEWNERSQDPMVLLTGDPMLASNERCKAIVSEGKFSIYRCN
jgi:hypothetical protein